MVDAASVHGNAARPITSRIRRLADRSRSAILALSFALLCASVLWIALPLSDNIARAVTSTIGGNDLSAVGCSSPTAVVPVDTKRFRTIGGPSSSFRLEQNQFVLTFDDGPMLWTTPHIAGILKARCVPATFFMIGVSSRMLPLIVDTVRSGGFQIGSHTYWHNSLPDMPIADSKAEILSGIEAVEAGGETVDPGKGRLFRFPRWESTPELVDYVNGLGATAVFADISAEDWRGRPAQESFALFRERLAKHDRGIIVLHDTQMETLKLLPMIIDEVTSRGGRFVQLVPSN